MSFMPSPNISYAQKTQKYSECCSLGFYGSAVAYALLNKSLGAGDQL